MEQVTAIKYAVGGVESDHYYFITAWFRCPDCLKITRITTKVYTDPLVDFASQEPKSIILACKHCNEKCRIVPYVHDESHQLVKKKAK